MSVRLPTRPPKWNRGIALERRGVDIAARTISAYASTADMDRYGTVFEPASFAASLRTYMNNPVVLAGHQHWYESGEAPVIGNVVSAAIDATGLAVDIVFAEGGIADNYWARYRDGFMRALSIGVLVNRSEQRKREDGSVYTVFTDVDLMEVSCVAVPGNPAALVRGVCTPDDVDRWAEGTLELAAARAAAPAEPITTPVAAPTVAGFTAAEIAALRSLLASAPALQEQMRAVRSDLDAVLASGRSSPPTPQHAAAQGRAARVLGLL